MPIHIFVDPVARNITVSPTLANYRVGDVVQWEAIGGTSLTLSFVKDGTPFNGPAVSAAAATGKAERFERLKAFLEDRTEPGDYTTLGMELGMAANTVAAVVHRLRQRYRDLVRAEIAHTVASSEEVPEEMRHLLSVLAQ